MQARGAMPAATLMQHGLVAVSTAMAAELCKWFAAGVGCSKAVGAKESHRFGNPTEFCLCFRSG